MGTITIESIMSIEKDDLQEAAKTIKIEDLPQLVEWLSLKDDGIRYQSFLMLQYRSQYENDVYPYWEVFRNKLKSESSYQRSIGLMLIAENAKWDRDNSMEDTIDDYLKLLMDEKPITIRQCIQSLEKIILHKPDLIKTVVDKLMSFDIMDVKETMRKSILMDILHILSIIRKSTKSEDIESFIADALSGEILDRKSKKQIEGLL